jgi:hypothetical protein
MRFYVSDSFRKNYEIIFRKNKCACNGKCGDACKCKSEQQTEEGD